MGDCGSNKKEELPKCNKKDKKENEENDMNNDSTKKKIEDEKNKNKDDSKNDINNKNEKKEQTNNKTEKSNEEIDPSKSDETITKKDNKEIISNKNIKAEEKNGIINTGNNENKTGEEKPIEKDDEALILEKNKEKSKNQVLDEKNNKKEKDLDEIKNPKIDKKKNNKSKEKKYKNEKKDGYNKHEDGEKENNVYYEYYSDSIRKKGIIGLRNLTNTCFMNSSLQCLSHIKPFYDKIKEEKTLGKLGLAFNELLVKMYSDEVEDKYYIPTNILDVMSSHFNQYKEGRQQGANEFISNFLTVFHEEMDPKDHEEKEFDEPEDKLLKKKFKKKYEFYMKNKSIIIDLFYGNIVRQTICKTCNSVISALYSIFNILELSIYKNRKDKEICLEQLFESYFSKQDDDCSILCKTCGKEVKPYSKTEIVHCPDILIIYINKVIDKKYYDNYINFPNELNLEKYIMQDKNKKKIYDLTGFIEHSGSEFGGHYTSKCKNFEDEKWYNFNDSFVDEVIIPKKQNGKIDSNDVIILFYQRKK